MANNLTACVRMLALITLTQLLFGCGKATSLSEILNASGKQTSAQVVREPTVDTGKQARDWIKTQAAQVTQPNEVLLGDMRDYPLNSQPQSVDRRLLRFTIAQTNQVFMPINTHAQNPPKPVSARTSAQNSLTPSATDGALPAAYADANAKTYAPQGASVVQTPLELNQANSAQITYVGTIQNSSQVYGLIKVGQRVYRVLPNDAIGAGKWRVVAVNSERMQLMVNAKVVNYDKQSH